MSPVGFLPVRLQGFYRWSIFVRSCYIARYTDVWNRHRESEIYDIHEIGSGTKLYYFWVKGYSTWGERDTIFLCWLLLHLPQTMWGTPSANYWSGLGGPRKSTFPSGRRNSTNCFSQIPKILSASGYDVIHLPRSHFLSGNFLFWHLWMTHPPHARVNTCVKCCT